MSEIVSRWPVRLSLALERDDRDAEQRLTDAAVTRMFGDARDAYFAMCTTVDPGAIEVDALQTAPGVPVDEDQVTITVGVVEIFPDAFTMEARIRSGEGTAAQAKCRFAVATGVDDAMRDEFIALAHAARYVN